MFLHADTMVPEKFDLAINKCLQTPGNVAGAFKFSLDILEIPEMLRLVICFKTDVVVCSTMIYEV